MAERERETVVVSNDGERRGGGTLMAVVAIILLLVVLFLVFGRGMLNGGGTDTIKADVNIDTPSK